MNLEIPANKADFGHYARLLRRGIWLILLFGVIAACLSLLYSETRTPLYQATSVILLQRDASTLLLDSNSGQRTSQQVTSAIEVEFLNSGTVQEEVHKRLHANPSF